MSAPTECKRVLNIIHPGYVRSKNDGQEHFISFDMLVTLHQLPPHLCKDINTTGVRSMVDCATGIEFRHFYPRTDGRYSPIAFYRQPARVTQKETPVGARQGEASGVLLMPRVTEPHHKQKSKILRTISGQTKTAPEAGGRLSL